MKTLFALVVTLLTAVTGSAQTIINVGDDWQTAVTAASPGTTFTIAAGVHRLQKVTPKAGDSFIGAPGARMSGAQVLSSWNTATGGTCAVTCYYATGQTQAGSEDGITGAECSASYPRCFKPEDVFFNDVPLVHASALATVAAGQWFFDYTEDRIYVGTNPSGATVETSVTDFAFDNTGVTIANVMISDLIIEKYATPGGRCAIYAPNSNTWTITRVEARLNHATGICVGTNSTVSYSRVYSNGLNGIGAYSASNLTINNNESYLNGAYFSGFWGSSGLKVAFISNSVLRNNYVHHNRGPGMWCDFDCNNVTLHTNTVEDNDQAGIFYEISFNGNIYGNVLRRNGLAIDQNTYPVAAAICIAASRNVEIFNNTIEDNNGGIFLFQESRGTSPTYGVTWAVYNVYVHDNNLKLIEGYNGLRDDEGTASYSNLNRFQRNNYRLSTAKSTYFYWMNTGNADSVWRTTYSQDTTGQFTR